MGSHSACRSVCVAVLDGIDDRGVMLQRLSAALRVRRLEAVFDQGTDRFLQGQKDKMEETISLAMITAS
jgi:hypothetical protein